MPNRLRAAHARDQGALWKDLTQMEGATPADAAAAAAAAAVEDGPNPAAAAEVRCKITVLLGDAIEDPSPLFDTARAMEAALFEASGGNTDSAVGIEACEYCSPRHEMP